MPMSNEVAGLLVADDRIKLLTFTGSAAVGWQLKSKAGKKRVTLELGGNAGVIVHSDADLAYAAHRCVVGGFAYGGQTCISVQRILVQSTVFDDFTNRLVRWREASSRPAIPWTKPPTCRRSFASRTRCARSEWIDEARQAGAKVLMRRQAQRIDRRADRAHRHRAADARELRRNLRAGGDGRAV